MKLTLANPHLLDLPTRIAFEDLMLQIQNGFGVEHDASGRHTNIQPLSVSTRGLTQAREGIDEATSQLGVIRQTTGQRVMAGPLLYGENGNNKNDTGAVLYPPQITANQHNYHPDGLDTALIVVLTSNGDYDITGLQIAARQARSIKLVNGNTSSGTFTLKHQSASSDAANRFSLPNSEDLELAPNQCVELFQNPDTQRFQAFGGTPGLGVTSSAALVTTVEVTASEINSLNTVPKTLVAAAGAGTIIVPVMIQWSIDPSTGYTSTVTGTVRWASGPTTATTISTIVQASNTDKRTFATAVTMTAITTNDIRNSDLQLVSNGSNTTGVGSLFVTVMYYIASGMP